MLWTLDLDAHGALTAVDVRRETVRSRAQHTYDDVPGARRWRCSPRWASAALAARARARRRLAADARAGGRRATGRLQLPRAAGRRGLQRPDVAADRHGGRRPDARGGHRPAAHPAAGRARGARRACAASRDALGRPWPEEPDYGDFIRSLDPFADRRRRDPARRHRRPARRGLRRLRRRAARRRPPRRHRRGVRARDRAAAPARGPLRDRVRAGRATPARPCRTGSATASPTCRR